MHEGKPRVTVQVDGFCIRPVNCEPQLAFYSMIVSKLHGGGGGYVRRGCKALRIPL